ncbi:MAG: type II toxin-antitoxin system MqsA family antitoxin [Opitutales bacterium]|nr:type II toxin-antitoxin system MqsA family antitoxin [Opitutales bacterium]MBQ8723879.1 type II toxin-antitoxin system MqsA family antitoxin [Opitutales bacterium]MBQ9759511.1 type II toxin-antitoxin system MqsA family antitoxin [Opitutales bacterium]
MSELYEEIMAGLQEALDIEKGVKKPRSVVTLPDNPKSVRKKLRLSQAQFSRFLGIKKDTLRNWEYGRRKMPETARRLLFIAEKHPEIILEMV